MGRLIYTVRPIEDRSWIRSSDAERESTRFSAKWPATESLLADEIAALDGENVVLQIDVREQDLRVDGTLRANAREAATPAVVLTFDSVHGPLMYRCDRFIAPWRHQGTHWQHNVRAIALTLGALRAVDRYGASASAEQYTGYRALGGGTPMPGPAPMSREDAVRVLDEYALGDWSLQKDGERIYRLARVAAHPDRHGGDHTHAYRVDEAAQVLGLA